MKTLFSILFLLIVSTVHANEPKFYLKFSNATFEQNNLAFDIYIFPIEKEFHLLSGNIRYNVINNPSSSDNTPIYVAGSTDLMTDAVTTNYYFSDSYINIAFSTSNLEGVRVSKEGYYIGRVFHKVNNIGYKNLSNFIQPRIYNLQGHHNIAPNTNKLNCTMIFTDDSPFESIQEGKPENLVKIHNDMKITQSDIDLYPNPTTNQLYYNIVSEANSPIEEISVLDAQGRVVMKIADPGQLQGNIDLTSYAPGMYYLMIKQDESISRHKVIKI